jgi:hypothetical protein
MSTVNKHRLGAAGILGAILALAIGVSCAADSSSQFPAGSPPGDPGNGGGTPSGNTGTCTTAQVAALFSASCGGCHGGSAPAAQLDLVSSNLEQRLSGKASSGCSGKVLVSPGNAAGSYLLDKLQGDATCGVQMPAGKPALDATSINCVADWIDGMGTTTGGTGGDTPGGGEAPGGGW